MTVICAVGYFLLIHGDGNCNLRGRLPFIQAAGDCNLRSRLSFINAAGECNWRVRLPFINEDGDFNLRFRLPLSGDCFLLDRLPSNANARKYTFLHSFPAVLFFYQCLSMSLCIFLSSEKNMEMTPSN